MSPAMTPRVSVVMPARNAARWVEQAVTSLLVQTWRDLEVVFVDDASTDGTAAIVESIGDPRVRVERLPANVGCGAALNVGLGLARGELVARLDADDYALPHRLARQVAFLDAHPDVGVVDASAHQVDGAGRMIEQLAVYTGRALHWALYRGCPIVHPAVMMRRAVLPPGGYPATHTRAEDYALWLTLAPRVRFEHLTEPLVVYRRHPDAIGAVRLPRLEEPRVWAELVGATLGLPLRAETAQAWLSAGRAGAGLDPDELAELALRLAPDRLDLGAHVPPWEPRALARCRRIHAKWLAALLWRGRGDRRLVRALAPVAARAAARGLTALDLGSRRGGA